MTCSGVYTALITPFDARGDLDLEGFRLHVKRQKQAGASGLVVLGSTGEPATLTSHEKETLLTTAKAEAHGLPLMAGCGSYSTTQTLENIERSADLGCDYALVVSPFYNKPTQEGIFRHYEFLSRKSPLPIFIYNNPARTCVNIDVETVKRICDLKNICGIKESSANFNQVNELLSTLKKMRPEFSFFCGDDHWALTMMALGADGVISGGIANLIPLQMVSLVKACQKGDFKKGREIHFALMPLFNVLCLESHPIPLKAVLQFAGLPGGDPRLPLTPLNPKYLPHLKDVWSSVIKTS